MLLCKGAAYALCLGSLRGGPIFPALFLGAALGVLLAPLPGLGVVPGLAAGMAASAAAALRLPVSSAVLVVLLMGSGAMTPVVLLAAVVGFVTAQLLPPGRPVPPLGKPAPHRPTPRPTRAPAHRTGPRPTGHPAHRVTAPRAPDGAGSHRGKELTWPIAESAPRSQCSSSSPLSGARPGSAFGRDEFASAGLGAGAHVRGGLPGPVPQVA
ncbi:chloride channel protein [Streptomyces sp. MS1.AVA.1]|uniref:Chloride channel protein n=1 Tax=Streptomyces machairae TaxID=3134109 RepID=A0ABU8UVG4_9ACTN